MNFGDQKVQITSLRSTLKLSIANTSFEFDLDVLNLLVDGILQDKINVHIDGTWIRGIMDGLMCNYTSNYGSTWYEVYDNRGNRVKLDYYGEVNEFTYDDLNRVVGISLDGKLCFSYEYSTDGKMICHSTDGKTNLVANILDEVTRSANTVV